MLSIQFYETVMGNVMFHFKRQVKSLLRNAGFQVSTTRAIRPLDFSEIVGVDPMTAIYAGNGKSVLIRVPVRKCVHWPHLAFPCHPKSNSPFIKTIMEIEQGVVDSYLSSSLYKFYQSFQPKNAAEMLGIELPSNKMLLEAPPGAAPFFWRQGRLEDRTVQRECEVIDDNREHGENLDAAAGDPFFGPVSLRKGELEFRRLQAIVKSIKSKGVVVDKNGISNINAICLYAENDWRYVIVFGGQHRIAALAALGIDDVVVQVRPEGLGGVVSRVDAEHWPMVKSGILTKTEALQIFDRIFYGQPHKKCY